MRWELPDARMRIVVLVDITDLGSRRQEQPAAQNDLLRLGGLGDWSCDLRSNTFHRGPALIALYRCLGLPAPGPAAERAGGPVDRPDDPTAESRQVALIRAALRDGAPVELHRMDHRVPGSPPRVLGCRAQVERGPDGSPLRVVGVVQDVTEQRTAEERAHRSGQRLTDLLTVVPVRRRGVRPGRPAGRRQRRAVRPARRAARRPPRPVRGGPHRAPRGAGATGFARWPLGQGAYQVDAQPVHRSDGDVVWCKLAVTVSIGDDGRRFWLVSFTDVGAPSDRAVEPAAGATGPTAPGQPGKPKKSAGPALLDELTGLPNRTATTQLISHLLAGSAGQQLCALCVGLDDLHRVTESLGHDLADDLRAKVADLLRRELPAACTVGRLATDDFVVVCSDAGELGGLGTLAERICKLLRSTVTVRCNQLAVSACVGAASAAVVPSTAADLLRFADAALHRARELGAGRVSIADEDMMLGTGELLRLESELRDAIATDQLVLEYQPVVGPDGTVRTAEALVRWAHPERGLLGPDQFLPTAQRGAMLRELDRWVLRAAAQEAATWPDHCGYPVSVAVNLAGLLPGDPEFAAIVTAAVNEANLPWNRLVLELVETCLVELPPSTLAVMDDLVARGVRFAVDDFGTGYSSLARLKAMPTQIVKVDRAFVAGVARDPADFALARAVVEIARAMGRRCVAEGVESADQYHVLRGIKVDAYQGWLFARPLGSVALREMIAGAALPTPQG